VPVGTAKGAAESGGDEASLPDIAMDAMGNAFAVWQQDGDPSASTRYDIMANRYVAGPGWGSEMWLENDNTNSAFAPKVAMNVSGNAIAVWQQDDGTGMSIFSNRYVNNIGWGSSELIETNGIDADLPQVDMNGKGDGVAVWQQPSNGFDSVWANRFQGGRSLSNCLPKPMCTALAGTLCEMLGSPFAVPSNGLNSRGLVIDPTSKYLYVANADSKDISLFIINTNGSLIAPVNGCNGVGGNCSAGEGVSDLKMLWRSDGMFLYATNTIDKNISIYLVDTSTGALNPLSNSPVVVGSAPNLLQVDPGGRYVYVTTDGDVKGFCVADSAGAVTNCNPLAACPVEAGALCEMTASPFTCNSGKCFGIAIDWDSN